MEWMTSTDLIDYETAVSAMERRVASIHNGDGKEAVWLLEHPPIYTAGTSAKSADLLSPRFPVYKSGRGGEYTYHGPGQRVGYVVMDLGARDERDLRQFVWRLEEWLIQTLANHFDITAERRQGRVGLWVPMNKYGGLPRSESKIAAIGVRVRKWITYHGVALNVNPDLSHFNGIVPCGVREHGVTSLHALGVTASMADVDAALKSEFNKVFG